MKLHENIKQFYYSHFEQLDIDKRFHFATRLAAWSGDTTAYEHLRAMKPLFVPEPLSAAAIRDTLSALVTNPPVANMNASSARKIYFEKYPSLRGIDFALFRVRHLQAVYGIDARDDLLQVVPLKELQALKATLLADHDAMRILSTYAINFLYLVERVLCEDQTSIDINALTELGAGYDLSNRTHIQLYIYLYTHCIIGETNFYTKRIPNHLMSAYKTMVRLLEQTIQAQYDQINLDNKLEFLVCSRIVGYQTALFERVFEECARSVSEQGQFLVDRHNANAQSGKTTLSASEHRNVLFIMSGSGYSPHTTLVS